MVHVGFCVGGILVSKGYLLISSESYTCELQLFPHYDLEWELSLGGQRLLMQWGKPHLKIDLGLVRLGVAKKRWFCS